MNSNDYDQEEEGQGKSKSQLKREMHALQVLGEALVELSAEQFAKIQLPEDLHEAILAARKIHQRGARKRQLQYIGKLMREVDAEPIQQQLDRLTGQSQEAALLLHRIERWRDELLTQGDEKLEALIEEYPQADRQHLRQLLRSAKKEAEENKAPKAARSLFRYLRDLIEQQP
jgi:ribosome-associated protein